MRTERPTKTKICTEVAHVTRDMEPLSRLKGQRSRSPGRFIHRRVATSGSCSGGCGNVLAVRNCCYVAVCSAARGASAPTGEKRGGCISWRPPARLQLVELGWHDDAMHTQSVLDIHSSSGRGLDSTLQHSC